MVRWNLLIEMSMATLFNLKICMLLHELKLTGLVSGWDLIFMQGHFLLLILFSFLALTTLPCTWIIFYFLWNNFLAACTIDVPLYKTADGPYVQHGYMHGSLGSAQCPETQHSLHSGSPIALSKSPLRTHTRTSLQGAHCGLHSHCKSFTSFLV